MLAETLDLALPLSGRILNFELSWKRAESKKVQGGFLRSDQGNKRTWKIAEFPRGGFEGGFGFIQQVDSWLLVRTEHVRN
jgi:hypothetical protein